VSFTFTGNRLFTSAMAASNLRKLAAEALTAEDRALKALLVTLLATFAMKLSKILPEFRSRS